LNTFNTFDFLDDDQTRRNWLYSSIKAWSNEDSPKIDVSPFGAFIQAREHLSDLIRRIIKFVKDQHSEEMASNVYNKFDADLADFISEERALFIPSPTEFITAVTIACRNQMTSILEPLRVLIASRNRYVNAGVELKGACLEALKAGYSGEEIYHLADTILTTNFGYRNTDLVPVSFDVVIRSLPQVREQTRVDAVLAYSQKIVGRLREYVNLSLLSREDSDPTLVRQKLDVLKIIVDKNFADEQLWNQISEHIGGFGGLKEITEDWFVDETAA